MHKVVRKLMSSGRNVAQGWKTETPAYQINTAVESKLKMATLTSYSGLGLNGENKLVIYNTPASC